MATITESDVVISHVVLRLDGTGAVTVYAQAKSLDAEGQQVRLVGRDITDQLTAAQLTSATTFMTSLTIRLKTLWGIS